MELISDFPVKTFSVPSKLSIWISSETAVSSRRVPWRRRRSARLIRGGRLWRCPVYGAERSEENNDSRVVRWAVATRAREDARVIDRSRDSERGRARKHHHVVGHHVTREREIYEGTQRRAAPRRASAPPCFPSILLSFSFFLSLSHPVKILYLR